MTGTMDSPTRSLAMFRARIFASCLSCLAIGNALAQTSDEERAAREEQQRQIEVARDLANQMQITVYDLDGNALGTIGEPGIIHGFGSGLVFSPDRSRIVGSRRDPQTQTSDLIVVDAETGAVSTFARSEGGENPRDPVWSPDGSEIAFVRPGGRFTIHRRRIDADPDDAGEIVYTHDGGSIRLGDWSLDGRYLLFSSGALESENVLYRLDLESGDEPVAVARDDRPMSDPRLSPDGRYVSYVSIDNTGVRYQVTRAMPGADSENESWQLPATGSPLAGFWDSDDPLFYQIEVSNPQDGPRVMAIPVDTSGDFEFGEPYQVGSLPDRPGAVMMTLSRNGERLLGTSRPGAGPQPGPPLITMLDREGNTVGRFGEPGRDSGPSFSPDGSRILAFRSNPEAFSSTLMIFDGASGEAAEVAGIDGGVVQANAVWTTDGEHIVFSSMTLAAIGDPDFSPTFYRTRADGQGQAETLFRAAPGVVVMNLADISPDDEYLLFESGGVVQTVRLEGDPVAREGVDVLRGEFEFEEPRFSPDMRLLAYIYNESGREEIYLTPFDAGTGMTTERERYPVSRGGTVSAPAWREDGEELYYLREMFETPALNDFEVMAVSVTPEPTLQIGTPRGLFDISAATATGSVRLQDVSPDGQRFLFLLPAPEE